MRITTLLSAVLATLVLLPACGGSSGSAPAATGLSFSFARVARTDDVLSVGTFNSNGTTTDPAIGDGGVIASQATVDGTTHVLVRNGTNFHLHAKGGDPRPGGGVWSASVENAVVDGGFTSFEEDSGGSGFFIVPNDASSPVAVIADTNTVVPDTAGNPLTGNPTFVNFGEHGRSGTLTIFGGVRNNGTDVVGLYMDDNGSKSLLFEEGDAFPLLGGTITFVSEPHARQGNWSVKVSTTTNTGIVANFGSGLEVIADSNDAVPSGGGNFGSFDESSLHGDRVVFQGNHNNGNGVYLYDRGTMTLITIADATVQVPGSMQNFNSAVDPSIAGDYVVFSSSSPVEGLYLYDASDGSLHTVLADGDTLEGKVVTTINKRDSYQVDGNRIGFGVTFSDGSSGIYIATINKP